MRILSLRFRNLNSLAGEWKIDFTNPEYVSSGIFAITGATGAGKSTILDAICLALYGRTPRLGKIAGNAGEILSRQTGEYFAEVEFHSEKGQYRCTWSQRRAHKKPDGELQSPRHEIVEVKTGKALETKQGAVQQKVIELTGLDYLQFTRSILLAQGEFATFLDAKAEDRAPILEKITGTEIYGQISIKVHERFSREKADLAVLNDRAENTEMISAEQAEELRKEKLDHEQVIKDISTRCTTLETAVKWLDTLAELEKEIADLRRRDLALADRKKAAGPDLDVLSLARKARSLEGIFAGLSALRGEQERDTAEKTSCEAQLAELNAAYEQVLETFRTAREKREATLQEKEREEGIIRTVRELDSKIRETTKNRDDRTEERRTIVETIRTYQNSLRGIESALTANRQELSVAVSYLESHAADQTLIESLSGIEEAFRQLDLLLEKNENLKQNLLETEQALARYEETIIIRKTEETRAAERLKRTEDEAGRAGKELAEITGSRDIAALREHADTIKDRENLLLSLLDQVSRIDEARKEEITHSQRITDLCEEKTRIETRLKELQKEEGHTAQLVKLAEEKSVLQARVESLEEERKKLVSGEPCPLCGSPDHPWRTGTIPVPDTLQRDLETFRTILMDLTKKIRENEKRHAAIDAEIKGHASEQEKLSTRITTLTTELQKKSIDLDLTLTGSDPKTVIPAALAECTAQLKAEQEILVRAETKEKQIRVLENRVNQERQALAGTRNESAKATNLRDSQNKEKDRISGEITKNNEEYEQKKRAILDTLQDYGDILVFSPGEMEQVLPELRERKDLYTKNISRKQKLEKELDGCDGELKTTQALLAASEEALGKLSEILSRIQETMSTLSEKRRDQYGEKDPAAEETRIIRLAEEAEKGYTLAAEAKTDADSKKNAWEGQIRSLTDRIAGRCRTLGEQEQVFARGLAEAGFPDESRFNAAQIPDKKLSELEEMENTLRREDLEIASGLREKTAKFAGERERALTTETREKLAEEIGNLKNQTIRLQIDIGGLRTKLEQYDEQLVKFQALTDEITKQKKECAKWQNLHDLIGSADGKKFRIFAQGLTFENLVVQANRHLRKMSDRYLLVRNRESPLDLDIQDNYQAGEIRTTKNLSGGERFLVSLALALGLSGMASRNIRIDSLFLDEGFGTLDDTTLETALETLSSLQREGKIIGIISHVPALKERIAVQIQVEKIGGGRSRLSGPGCSGPD